MEDLLVDQQITLRLAQRADEDFLLRVYASTRADELAMVPWTDEQKNQFVRMQFNAQRSHYQASNSAARQFVVLRSGEAVGRWWIAHQKDEIRILDVTILPAQRNAGIGTQLLLRALSEGQRKKKSVSVYVETFNPSRRLFERLGFVAVETQGMHALMKWTPGKEDT